jgi:hypothetical protein
MKYYYSNVYQTLYFLENRTLCGVTRNSSGLLDADEAFVVNLDNGEVSREFYIEVAARLSA